MSIIDKFKQFENNAAIIWNGNAYTYGSLLSTIASWEKVFKKQGLFNKKIIAIKSDYFPSTIGLFLALMKNKFIVTPINSNASEEVDDKILIAEAEVIIKVNADESYDIEFTDNKFNHPLVKNLVQTNKAGLILFSSGSTGKPKAMVYDLDRLGQVYMDKKQRDLKTIVLLMFDHIGGINTIFNILSSGGTAVLPLRRDPEEVCELIEKYKVNILPTTPTFLNLILVSDSYKRHDISSLKLITYGTEPMPESLLKRLKGAFPNIKFLQTFGTSETGIITTRSKSSESLYMKLEDENFEYKIVDNELWIRSKIQILGYLNQESPFTKEGWFPTGDLVEEVDDGYLKIIGRKKEMINVGGQKVAPMEVESVLLESSMIKDAVVYGEVNPLMGEIVAAKIVLNDNGEAGDGIIKEIKKFCHQKLDAYKVPVKINIVDKLDISDRYKKRRIYG